MYCPIDTQTSRNELNTMYVILERTQAALRTRPDAHIPHTCTLSLAQYVSPSLSDAFPLFLSLTYNVSVCVYIHTHTCILHTDCDSPSSSTPQTSPQRNSREMGTSPAAWSASCFPSPQALYRHEPWPWPAHTALPPNPGSLPSSKTGS